MKRTATTSLTFDVESLTRPSEPTTAVLKKTPPPSVQTAALYCSKRSADGLAPSATVSTSVLSLVQSVALLSATDADKMSRFPYLKEEFTYDP